MLQLTVQTHNRTELVDITADIQSVLHREKFNNGLCMIYIPHTTAGVTINESADPSVKADIMMVLNRMVPWQAEYRHLEGNSPAHVKASLVGASQMVAVTQGNLQLGTWQGIFFCEFDGPRTRKVQITLLPGA